jgi:hypothetical protein
LLSSFLLFSVPRTCSLRSCARSHQTNKGGVLLTHRLCLTASPTSKGKLLFY